MSTEIHPSAIVEDGAVVGEGCSIGPFAYVGPNVKMGAGNILHSHAVIDGNTTMGDNNEVYSFACLGKQAQDLKFEKGMTVYATIGSGNTFRECVTVNTGSVEGSATIIGDNCLLQSYVHIAHDCELGNNIVLSSAAMMSGHCHVGNNAIIGGKTGIVQFVHIGELAFVGGFNKVTKDILTYCIADGSPAVLRAVNKIGLERNGFAVDEIKAIRDAYKVMIRSGKTLEEASTELTAKYPDSKPVQRMIEFAQNSKVGIARPRGRE